MSSRNFSILCNIVFDKLNRSLNVENLSNRFFLGIFGNLINNFFNKLSQSGVIAFNAR